MPVFVETCKYPYFHDYFSQTGDSTPVKQKVVRQDVIGTGFVKQTRNSNPSYKVQIAQRRDASTYFSRDFFDYQIGIAQCNVVVKQPGFADVKSSYATRYSGLIPSSFPTSHQATDDRALAKIKRKIQMHTGDFNALVPMAQVRELRSTVTAAANLSSGLLQTLIQIRKTKGRSAFKYASEAWLTYGFGLAPLVSDAKDICDSIQAYLLRQDHSSVLTGSESTDWVDSHNDLSFGDTADTVKFRDKGNVKYTYSCRYKGGFNFDLRSAVDYGALDHFNFKLPALIPTAWELVPFSWVADYFGTVGAFLDDCFTGSPVNPIYLNRTRKLVAEGYNQITFEKSYRGTVFLVNIPSKCKWRYTWYERTPLQVLPRRSLRFYTADEVGKNSLNKLSNLAAILGMGKTNVLPRKPWR